MARKPRAKPAPAPEPVEDLGPPRFDAERLAAEIRSGDSEALAPAAKQLFDTGLGRTVLAAFLMDNGVGRAIARPGMTAEELFYAAGRHDAALSLVETVYDQASLIVNLFTTTKEENHHALEIEPEGEFVSGLGYVGDPDKLG